MLECSSCKLFDLESQGEGCFHVNRPGGLDLTRAAIDLAQLPANSRVLDVASGAGGTVHFLNTAMRCKAVGIDLSFESLKLGRDHLPGLSLAQAECQSLPVPANSQQALLIECALSLTGVSLYELLRVLQPGGRLIITDIYLREVHSLSALECLAKTNCLTGVNTRDYIERQVIETGFSILLWQDQTPLFKQWLARMVFKLGSLESFYRHLAACESDAHDLAQGLKDSIKLGYYLLIAQKPV